MSITIHKTIAIKTTSQNNEDPPHIHLNNIARLDSMLFYPTIARKYFVKTQTYVALFGPHELSLIFSGGMCLELTSL